MRGDRRQQESMFSYVSPEARVPKRHPLRPIREMVDRALAALDDDFETLYSHTGRPSIPPEYLLRATLLQILYSIRSERLLVEQIDYNLLFRWFIGLSMDDAVWDHSSFTKNRDRLLEADIARRFFVSIKGVSTLKSILSLQSVNPGNRQGCRYAKKATVLSAADPCPYCPTRQLSARGIL
jgi:transposase